MKTDFPDAMTNGASPLQPLSAAPSMKAAWEAPTISSLETACTAGDAKAPTGSEAIDGAGPS